MHYPVVYRGSTVCNELIDYTETTQTSSHHTLHAQADLTHRCSFKKSLLTRTPDHSPPTTHSAEGGGKWTRDIDLTVVPLKPAPVTANQSSLALDKEIIAYS